MNRERTGLLLAALLTLPASAFAGAGREAASFLEIPVGGGPAALGGAYTALAADAYATDWNPAGLGFLDSMQTAGQHLSYLESMHYEHLGLAVPFAALRSCPDGLNCGGSGVGASVRYLGSGDIAGMDEDGDSTGDFSSYYAAWSLAYGHAVNYRFAWGVTAKMIDARLSDVRARAFAGDLGLLFRPTRRLTVGAALLNSGTDLEFIREGGSLPMAFRLGAAFEPTPAWRLSVEGAYRKNGLASGHAGVAWRPLRPVSIRVGYRTDTLRGLGALAGLSTGIGLEFWGQEFAYAWLPYGDLGNSQYFSMVLRFGGPSAQERRDLIRFRHLREHRTADRGAADDLDPDYQQLMQLLSDSDVHTTLRRAEGRTPR